MRVFSFRRFSEFLDYRTVYLSNNNNNNMYNSVFDMIIINWRTCRLECGRFRWPPGTDVRACKRLYFYYYFSYVFPVLLSPLCVCCLFSDTRRGD